MEITRTRSAGGIVIGDHGTIAMVRRTNSNGAWLFPKGHIEAGETDEEAARREIAEESSLTGLEFIDDLGTYERHPILPNGEDNRGELKEIHMYLFAAPQGAEIRAETEMDGAQWVPLARVIDACGNPADRAWFTRVFEAVRHAVQRD